MAVKLDIANTLNMKTSYFEMLSDNLETFFLSESCIFFISVSSSGTWLLTLWLYMELQGYSVCGTQPVILYILWLYDC